MRKENVYKRDSEEQCYEEMSGLVSSWGDGYRSAMPWPAWWNQGRCHDEQPQHPRQETCSHSRSTSAWYWSAVFPGEISVVQGQQDHLSGKWFISGQLILSKSVKKSQRATVSEHTNCSKPITRILDCSEKKVCLLSSNDTSKNYNIQREKETKYFNIFKFWHVPFEIPE